MLLLLTDRCGNQNGAFSGSELAQGLLTVSLRTVAVDTGTGVPLSIQEVLQGVSPFLGLHKNQSQGVLPYRTENTPSSDGEYDLCQTRCSFPHLYVCSHDDAKTNDFFPFYKWTLD